MAGVLILVFASVGLLGIGLGIWAWRYVSHSARRLNQSHWLWIRLAALIVGLPLGVASVSFDTVFGYPISTHRGPGRIARWPFIEAFFDSDGNDYVGLLTYISALGNFIFWFLVPQFFLAGYARRALRRHGF
jgi:hypothetical protein